MKRYLLLAAFAAAVSFGCVREAAPDLAACDSFARALPVWAEGRETEKNLTLSFREVIDTRATNDALIRIAASTD